MKQSAMLTIDGVFLAVKCAICGTVYNAAGEDFVAFYGGVARGLEQPILDCSAPKRPAKRSVVVVCRTPDCLGGLVRDMLGCPPGEEGDAMWQHALTLWAGGVHPAEATEPPLELTPKEKVARKRARRA